MAQDLIAQALANALKDMAVARYAKSAKSIGASGAGFDDLLVTINRKADHEVIGLSMLIGAGCHTSQVLLERLLGTYPEVMWREREKGQVEVKFNGENWRLRALILEVETLRSTHSCDDHD